MTSSGGAEGSTWEWNVILTEEEEEEGEKRGKEGAEENAEEEDTEDERRRNGIGEVGWGGRAGAGAEGKVWGGGGGEFWKTPFI